jgi:hypothetical protein
MTLNTKFYDSFASTLSKRQNCKKKQFFTIKDCAKSLNTAFKTTIHPIFYNFFFSTSNPASIETVDNLSWMCKKKKVFLAMHHQSHRSWVLYMCPYSDVHYRTINGFWLLTHHEQELKVLLSVYTLHFFFIYWNSHIIIGVLLHSVCTSTDLEVSIIAFCNYFQFPENAIFFLIQLVNVCVCFFLLFASSLWISIKTWCIMANCNE